MEIINNFDGENDSDKFTNLALSQNSRKKSKKIIDFNAILIIFGLLMGFIITGSFGIDFFSNDEIKIPGGEVKAFEQNGKTWVAFDDPVVNVRIITDKDCENCDYQEVIEMIKSTAIPTLNVQDIGFETPEAVELIETFFIKSIPALIFDNRLVEIKEYEQIKDVFLNKDENYYLNTAMIGIPVGRYLEVFQISDNDISKGSEDAKITIVEFSDFECPFCSGAKETVQQVLDKYGEDVRIVFKHFPLPIHDNAKKAAEASECANDQGKFWEMHDAMFEDQNKLLIPDLKKTAKNLDLDVDEFSDCLDSGKYEEKVQSDIEIGLAYGISGTPAFFINNEFLSGAQPFEEFENIIEKKINNN
ncbi:DsbA family protein [Patescibacteria group bacterium]|nr:DsbA family protein [Patescibacteria group bacterium]